MGTRKSTPITSASSYFLVVLAGIFVSTKILIITSITLPIFLFRIGPED